MQLRTWLNFAGPVTFRLATRVFTLHQQLRHHQFLVHSLTRNEFFAARVVRVPLHT